MRFSEIASRLTGISTPVFGVSWTPARADVEVARSILMYLEDRRVLYDPIAIEVAEQCVASVLEIRQFLTQVLTEGQIADELADHLRAMRAECRKFLGEMVARGDGGEIYLPYGIDIFDPVLNQALGELRGVFGIHVAQIAVKYGLDVDEPLAYVLPAPSSQDDE